MKNSNWCGSADASCTLVNKMVYYLKNVNMQLSFSLWANTATHAEYKLLTFTNLEMAFIVENTKKCFRQFIVSMRIK